MLTPFIASSLPIPFQLESPELELLGECNRVFGKYIGKMSSLQNPNLLMQSMTMNEATLSSRIEGTKTELDEALDSIANADNKEDGKYLQNQDDLEVRNYFDVLTSMADYIKGTGEPITLKLIRDSHQWLLKSGRGADKNPGCFRGGQNWIGRTNKIEDANFVPPEPTSVPMAMANWVEYAQHGGDDIFVHLAFLHAQFELIHPFEDGNGRLGRMLITLILCSRGHLDAPLFYLSEYLEKHRRDYYDSLLRISRDGDWRQWVNFFLQAVRQQGLRYCDQIDEIKQLYDDYKVRIPQLTRSQHAIGIIDFIFTYPRFTISFLVKRLEIERVTAYSIVNKLCQHGFIVKIAGGRGRSPSRYRFSGLLDIILSEWDPL